MISIIVSAFLLLTNVQAEEARPSAGSFALRHSFKPPFEKGVQKPFWRAGAGAYVEENYVRVTPAKQSRTGFLWNTVPSTMVDWQVDIEFMCTGHKNYGGDGFAFWYAEQKSMIGGVFGSIDYWNGLGIFFDTYNNDNQGASSVVVAIDNDGTQTYNTEDDGAKQGLGSCGFMMRNTAGPLAARIKYQSGELVVSMSAAVKEGEVREYTPCFTLENIELGLDKYFGISAHTGDVADNHDIYSFIVTDLSPAGVDLEAVRERYRQKIEKQHHLPKHEEMAPEEFQHTVLTMMHQSQEALNLIEVSQIAIGDYLHSALDGLTTASTATAAAPAPAADATSGRPAPATVDHSSILNQINTGVKTVSEETRSAQQSVQQSLKDMQRTLNDLRTQLQRVSSGSPAQEGGSESWLSFLMTFAILVTSCYHCFLTWNSQKRWGKLP